MNPVLIWPYMVFSIFYALWKTGQTKCPKKPKVIYLLNSPSSSSSSSLLKVMTGFLDFRDFWGVTKLSSPWLETQGFDWPATRKDDVFLKRQTQINFCRILQSDIRCRQTSLWPGTASGGKRCVHDRLISWSSLIFILLVHLRTFYILQTPCVNCSQSLFKLINLGLGETSKNKLTFKFF